MLGCSLSSCQLFPMTVWKDNFIKYEGKFETQIRSALIVKSADSLHLLVAVANYFLPENCHCQQGT
jgi:hypothetical protein